MTTTITDRLMTSDATPHTARRVQLAPERWRASWLPEKLLDRNQAITAMTIAELVRPGMATGRDLATVRALAAELGLGPVGASVRVLREPHVLDRRLHVLSVDCWCRPAATLDGHINEDGSVPDFAATDDDPVDADGFLLEEVR